jgi:asparagine synthase (glutamine-hydrolysing)
MCGIVAAVVRNPAETHTRMPEVERILDAISYRGPDARGLWHDERVVLGHRRLSIIDLSEAGTQPMHDRSGGLHITFNGEIYNYRELRRDLEAQGYCFHSSTDTEVILAAYCIYGRDFLSHLLGMFAFVLYDEPGGCVLLCRDRLGKKPLLYYHDDERLLAASELKCMYAFQDIDLDPDPAAVADFFSLHYVPGPGTILRGIRKVEPGECIELHLPDWKKKSRLYWSVLDYAGRSLPDAGIDEVDAALQDSVRYRLIADVEVGVLLSGGIDSSLLAACAAGLSTSPLKAFLVSFSGSGLDESAYACMVARSLNIELIKIDGGGLEPDTLSRVMYHTDELMGDPAAVPTFMIAQVIRQHVKVVLSGEGADELFWGYDYYRRQMLFDRVAAFLPRLRPGKQLRSLLSGIESSRHAPGALSRLCKILADDADTGCSRWTSVYGSAAREQLLTHAPGPASADTVAAALAQLRRRLPSSEAALTLDLLFWLPDDLLVKVDRCSMAHAVEARAPYLDHRLVELALRLAPSLKIGPAGGKQVLRELLRRRLAPETAAVIAARPKHGFDVPLDAWLQGPLRAPAEEFFSDAGLKNAPMLNAPYVAGLWRDFKAGRTGAPFARKLWLVLCFMTWYAHHTKGFGFR